MCAPAGLRASSLRREAGPVGVFSCCGVNRKEHLVTQSTGEWVSLPKVAKELKLSYHAARDLLFRGKLEGDQIDRNWLVTRSSLDRELTRRAKKRETYGKQVGL